MTFYVQMKDNVAFAYVESNTPVENSILLQDGINPESVLAHKFIDGEWEEAPLIYFIERISDNGIIEKTNSTVYSSDITGEVIPWYVGPGWKKENGQWVNFIELQQQQQEEDQLQNAVDQILNSRPYPSWVWSSGQWLPPTPRPEVNSDDYYWDEQTLSWQTYIDGSDQTNEISD